MSQYISHFTHGLTEQKFLSMHANLRQPKSSDRLDLPSQTALKEDISRICCVCRALHLFLPKTASLLSGYFVQEKRDRSFCRQGGELGVHCWGF